MRRALEAGGLVLVAALLGTLLMATLTTLEATLTTLAALISTLAALISTLTTLAALITALSAGVVLATAEELDHISDDFGSVALGAGLVLPFACAELAFDIELGAFGDEAFHRVGEAAPCYDVVPFGVFMLLAIAVAIPLGGGEGERGDFCVLAIGRISFKVTDFRVFADVTD